MRRPDGTDSTQQYLRAAGRANDEFGARQIAGAAVQIHREPVLLRRGFPRWFGTGGGHFLKPRLHRKRKIARDHAHRHGLQFRQAKGAMGFFPEVMHRRLGLDLLQHRHQPDEPAAQRLRQLVEVLGTDGVFICFCPVGFAAHRPVGGRPVFVNGKFQAEAAHVRQSVRQHTPGQRGLSLLKLPAILIEDTHMHRIEMGNVSGFMADRGQSIGIGPGEDVGLRSRTPRLAQGIGRRRPQGGQFHEADRLPGSLDGLDANQQLKIGPPIGLRPVRLAFDGAGDFLQSRKPRRKNRVRAPLLRRRASAENRQPGCGHAECQRPAEINHVHSMYHRLQKGKG